MSTEILFRPLNAWPFKLTPSYERREWPNARTLTLTRALGMVADELRLMYCDRGAHIEVDVEEKYIRNDGQLRANASAKTPGCIIYAKHRKLGDLRWACDQFTRLEYNVRAIAATIESLRAVVARAGVPWLQMVEQFRVADRQALQARLDEVVAGGGEGLMLHRADAPYLTGRSDALLKLKPLLDAEATVIAHLPGRGRLEGMMGALLVETAQGVRFQLGTGFSDAQRDNPPILRLPVNPNDKVQ